MRHASAAWLELLFYALRKRRLGLLARSAAAESAYFIFVCLLWRWKPVQTLWAFILPYIITSAALMFGNWCELYWSSRLLPCSCTSEHKICL